MYQRVAAQRNHLFNKNRWLSNTGLTLSAVLASNAAAH